MGKQKIEIREIYKQIRSDFKDKKVRSYNLITMDQIRYHLKKISNDLSNDDFKNLRLLFEREQKLDKEKQFIRFYKERTQKSERFQDLEEEQFFMVIMNQFQIEMINNFNNQNERVITMDGTFGLNNKKVLLITLMMIDEFGNGLPLAFCLSERENEVTISAFLTIVRELVGDINAQYFMSDDANQYFNSWKSVMINNSKVKKILCSWHIFKNFKLNVREKIRDSKKQEEVLRKLIQIRNSQNIENAKTNLINLINELKSSKSTILMGNYLKSHYLNRLDQWVYCTRDSLIPNTNMHIESMHRLIKIIFLSSKRIQKISSCIQMLRDLVEQKMIDRIVKLTYRRCDKKTNSIYQAHLKAEEEISNYELGLFYIDDETNAKVYEIISSEKRKYYTVFNDLKDHTCEFSCKKCTICSHYMNCTCPEFLNNRKSCKHMHMIALEFELICVNIVNESKSNFNMFNDDDVVPVIESLPEKNNNIDQLVKDNQFYLEKLNHFNQTLEKENNTDKLLDLKLKLKRVCSEFIEINNTEIEEATKKRKLDKQIRF